jgi:endonuclease III
MRPPASKGSMVWQIAPREGLISEVCELLSARYGECDLGNYSNPIDELVFICLTRQTHQKNAARSWAELQRLGGPQALLDRPEEDLVAAFKPSGLASQKVAWLRSSLEAVRRTFGALTLEPLLGWDDTAVERYLTGLQGVSIKTAKCVMMYSLDRQVLPVDTHVRRVAERLGWVRPRLTEARIHGELEALVPAHLRSAFHVNAIWHGRQTCKAVARECGACVLQAHCASVEVRR